MSVSKKLVQITLTQRIYSIISEKSEKDATIENNEELEKIRMPAGKEYDLQPGSVSVHID